jgi:hypothetical protein
MELPLVVPEPVVTEHAALFRDLFDNHCQSRHFPYAQTRPVVRPSKSLAHITRSRLDSVDHPPLSRSLPEAPWEDREVNRRRIRYQLQQFESHRQRRRDLIIVTDDTLCAHVGSHFDYEDWHDHLSDATCPWRVITGEL